MVDVTLEPAVKRTDWARILCDNYWRRETNLTMWCYFCETIMTHANILLYKLYNIYI